MMAPEEFEEIYRTHYQVLRKAARHLIGDTDAAHDVVQEVFLKLWNKKDELAGIINPGAYLYRSVVNTSLNHIQQNKRRRSSVEAVTIAAIDTSDSAVELKELQARIAAAIEKLPAQCRAIFVLSRLEEKKNREIAEIMNLSLKTVENQMGIALKKMREELHPYLRRDNFDLTIVLATALATAVFPCFS